MCRLLAGVFLAALLISPSVNALDAGGGSLVVHVSDPQEAGLLGARVTVQTRDRRVRLSKTTETNGSCRFDGLAEGDYLLSAEAAGFAPAAASVVHVGRGPLETRALRLRLAGREETLVVTGSGTLQTADEVSKAVTSLDRDSIEARDAIGLPDALRAVPGLFVQQLGGPGAFTSIKIRGLRTEDTAVLIDGVRFRDAAATQGDASAFLGETAVTNVEQVEILKGSGSSLYGSHAIGGAVNVITRAGAGAPNGTLLAEAGSLGLARARGQLAGGLRQDRIGYSLGISHLDVADGVDGDDHARNTSTQGRIDFRLPSNASVSARIYGADSVSRLNESPGTIGRLPATGIVPARPLALAELHRYEAGTPAASLIAEDASFIPSANDPDNHRESSFVSALLAFEQRANRWLGYSVTYHGLATNRTHLDGPRGVSGFEPSGPTRAEFDGRLHTGTVRADAQWAKAQLTTISFELEGERFVNRTLAATAGAATSAEVTQRSRTFVVQHQLQTWRGFEASAAFRAQVFSLAAPALVPAESAPYQGVAFSAPPSAYTGDASVAYLVARTGTKLRAHAGNGYRAPSLYERFGSSFGSFGYSVYGDPRLAPERSGAYDVGVEQTLSEGRVRLSATWFYTRLREVIAFDFSGAIRPDTDPFGRSFGYLNADGRAARGVELSTNVKPSLATQIGASYTFSDSDPPSGQADLTQAYGVPRHAGAVTALHRVGRWQAALDVVAVGSHLAPVFDASTFTSRAFRFDGYVDANLVVSYALPVSARGRLRLFAKADNLADAASYPNGFRAPGRMLVGGASLQF